MILNSVFPYSFYWRWIYPVTLSAAQAKSKSWLGCGRW